MPWALLCHFCTPNSWGQIRVLSSSDPHLPLPFQRTQDGGWASPQQHLTGVAKRGRLRMDVVQVSEIIKGTERWSSLRSTTLSKEAMDDRPSSHICC